MRIEITAFGETEVSREIMRFSDRASDMTPAFDEIRRRFHEIEKEQFNTGGRYSGGWAPLKASTIAGKRRAGLSTDILVATGRLKKSLTEEGGDEKYRADADGMLLESEVEYGKYHQSKSPRTRLPRRPPVEIPQAERREWVKVLQRYLVTGMV